MKILAFAGSNSAASINKQLVSHAASLFNGHDVEILDLNDYELPLFGIDREKKDGIPRAALDFAAKIDQSDLLLISLAEHNGAYSAVFKNLFDWLSRIPDRVTFGDKDIFLMATSPGGRGGASVLEMAQARFKFNNGNIVGTFSLPFFSKNFEATNGIIHPELKTELKDKIQELI